MAKNSNLQIIKFFHEYVWKRYLPPSASLYFTDYSNVVFISEIKNGNVVFSTLDKLAQMVKNRKGLVSAFGRYFHLNKGDAMEMAEDLNTQAEQLINLANTYKIMATALTMSIENIEDIIKTDPLIKKELENPF